MAHIKTLGLVAAVALMSSAASAETINTPFGKIRIDAKECRGDKVCARVTSQFGAHSFTVSKSQIEKFMPKSKGVEPESVPPMDPPPAAAAPAAPAPAQAAEAPAAPQPQAPAAQAYAPAPAAPAQAAPAPAQPALAPVQAAPVQPAPSQSLADTIPVEPAPAAQPQSRPVVASVQPAAAPQPAEPAAKPVQAAANSPVGEWITEKGEGRIRIQPCGENLCGYVATVKDPNEKDSKNPDPALRNRPLLGTPVLLNMKPTRSNRWDGKIYNTRNGSTYVSHMSMRNTDNLRVEGCLMMFCGGQTWTRAQ